MATTSTPIKRPASEATELLLEWRRNDKTRFVDQLGPFIANIVDFDVIDELTDVLYAAVNLCTGTSNVDKENNSILRKFKLGRSGSGQSRSPYIFGAHLTTEGCAVITQLIEVLSKDSALKTEGIFRKSGNNCCALRTDLETGNDVPWGQRSYTVHDVAATLKQFLNELPQPLIPTILSNIYMKICDFERTDDLHSELQQKYDQNRVDLFAALLMVIPDENRDLLLQLVKLLNDATLHEEWNKMNSWNMGLMLAPAVFGIDKPSSSPRQQRKVDYSDSELAAPPDLVVHANKKARFLSLLIENHEFLRQPPQALVGSVLRSKYGAKIPADLTLLDDDYNFGAANKKRRIPFPKFFNKSRDRSLDVLEAEQVTPHLALRYADATRSPKVDMEVLGANLCAQLHSMPENTKKEKKNKERLTKRFQKEYGNEALRFSESKVGESKK